MIRILNISFIQDLLNGEPPVRKYALYHLYNSFVFVFSSRLLILLPLLLQENNRSIEL